MELWVVHSVGGGGLPGLLRDVAGVGQGEVVCEIMPGVSSHKRLVVMIADKGEALV